MKVIFIQNVSFYAGKNYLDPGTNPKYEFGDKNNHLLMPVNLVITSLINSKMPQLLNGNDNNIIVMQLISNSKYTFSSTKTLETT